MSQDEQEKRWMAYLDGQLTASEALEFEESLSPRERVRLNGELRLESAIGDSLNVPESCPEALWKRLVGEMQCDAPAKPARWSYWLSRGGIALAATAAIVILAPYYSDSQMRDDHVAASNVGIEETSLADFREHSEVPANFAAAQAYLRDHDIDLTLVRQVGASGGAHDIEFVGVCEGKCPKRTLFELRFICCGKPAKVLVARRGTAGERLLRQASRCGDTRETRILDDFITAVVCGHDSPDLLNVIQPRGSFI